MSVERTFYCDGPDCDRSVRTIQTRSPHFLTVSEGADDEGHFCGWDCLLRFAADKPPEEVVPAEISD
jgi:hypothetical protein